ncbi:phage holin family protein [Megalodesulfovibrio gigas]|uniref:Toxin secretion/phage lysis holin n=1 Tax=Megalodesulfovibrio gigas (strain ATCC 19364 / DSM 1382 / NCIMB 9332 / VKM B-1759) TaxID=1121448 RepID=T2GDE3_MEGG1|nr:phage holin family protein [Megalodesulfovibrio gigas]AGW14131.1 hypothetical protein DGI_2379 [Megalodesulfovibrio gigas DSM 1382 = ATCC 19364]
MVRDMIEQWRTLADHCGVKSALAAAGAYLVGPVDAVVWGLVTLLVLDFALGFGRAWTAGTLSGRRMLHGAGKFVLFGLAVVMGHVLDAMFLAGIGLEFPVTCRNLIIVYLALSESLSICEHLACLNVPLPARLVARLKCYRDEISNTESASRPAGRPRA